METLNNLVILKYHEFDRMLNDLVEFGVIPSDFLPKQYMYKDKIDYITSYFDVNNDTIIGKTEVFNTFKDCQDFGLEVFDRLLVVQDRDYYNTIAELVALHWDFPENAQHLMINVSW